MRPNKVQKERGKTITTTMIAVLKRLSWSFVAFQFVIILLAFLLSPSRTCTHKEQTETVFGAGVGEGRGKRKKNKQKWHFMWRLVVAVRGKTKRSQKGKKNLNNTSVDKRRGSVGGGDTISMIVLMALITSSVTAVRVSLYWNCVTCHSLSAFCARIVFSCHCIM